MSGWHVYPVYFHIQFAHSVCLCTDLLSVLIPSTKCLLPGRNVYHWRRRRNNRRVFPTLSPCLPLTSSSLPPTLDTCFHPCSSLLPVHKFCYSAPSSNSLLSCLPDSWKPHSEWRAHTPGSSSSSLGPYTTAVRHNLTHYSQSTPSVLSSHHSRLWNVS